MLTTPKVQISSSEDNSPSNNDEIPAFYETCAVLQIGSSLVRSQLLSVDFSLT